MTDNPGQAAPGWYPDPSGSPRQRYYDGEMWTDNYHDEAAPIGASGGVTGDGYATQAQQALDPVSYWKKVMLENYANFDGRARRAEYWWAYLINVVILVVLVVIAGALTAATDGGLAAVFALPGIYVLGMLIPTLAVAVRRLHDTGKSGWFYLISFIPFGGIVLIVFMATDGDRGSNEYGPSPKY